MRIINLNYPIFLIQSLIFFFCGTLLSNAQDRDEFPLLDLHVHLADSLSIEKAVSLAEKKGMKFGIVEHPGLCEYCPINNDDKLKEYIQFLREYPVYAGLQPVVPGWRELFSDSLISELDYVIMDALEIPQEDGSIWRLWLEDTKVDDIDAFMEMYVDYHVRIIENEGFDILANATFLPKCIENEYERAWTKDRMQKVIDAVVKNNVAIEINSYYKVPGKEFIKLAKASGAKFSFGTNSRDSFAGTTDYAMSVVKECNLLPEDIYVPNTK